MKFASAVIKVIEILGIWWLISPAVDSVEVKLNLTGRPANQSSTYVESFGNAYASLAIDGNYNSYFYAGFCSHTDDPPGGTSWWRIDLGQPVKVQRVVLVNRGDCCGFRLDNYIVGLTNISTDPVRGEYALCGQYPGPAANGAYLNLQCHPRTTTGRYVIVQQSSNVIGPLTICEIEIYAGQVRKLNRWERLSNQRMMSVTGSTVVLSKRSAMMCVGKCKETVDCESVNYHQLDNTCELNFLPSGADGSNMVTEDGWDNWVQMYEFI